jgi:hypothetical protein
MSSPEMMDKVTKDLGLVVGGLLVGRGDSHYLIVFLDVLKPVPYSELIHIF